MCAIDDFILVCYVVNSYAWDLLVQSRILIEKVLCAVLVGFLSAVRVSYCLQANIVCK